MSSNERLKSQKQNTQATEKSAKIPTTKLAKTYVSIQASTNSNQLSTKVLNSVANKANTFLEFNQNVQN